MNVHRVCVHCASSRQCDPACHKAAAELGRELAAGGVTIVYGGSLAGSMGALANAALEIGGKVIGILPQFMFDLELGYNRLTELIVVNDTRAETPDDLGRGCGRRAAWRLRYAGGDIRGDTWKRPGLFTGSIGLVNTLDFFSPCIEPLNHCIEHRFMDARHALMWSVVDRASEVLDAIRRSP